MKLGQDCYIVRDANGHALAYVYFEDEPGRRPAAHLMTRDGARHRGQWPSYPTCCGRPRSRQMTRAALRISNCARPSQSFIRNDMTIYIKNAGHCTRCGDRFGDNATAYMVREKVAWTVRGDIAFTQREIVAVCDACVTLDEQERCTEHVTCKGCGQRMMSQFPGARPICSNRCAQRELRSRRRAAAPLAFCKTCGTSFRRSRVDVKYCSSACRQAAYRQRRAPL
jgi:hypothetical protein